MTAITPTIAKISNFTPSAVRLAQTISNLHHRVEWSRVSVGVDWNVIRAAIESTDNEVDREELLLSWIGEHNRSGLSDQSQEHCSRLRYWRSVVGSGRLEQTA
jgi:hypothetical protein